MRTLEIARRPRDLRRGQCRSGPAATAAEHTGSAASAAGVACGSGSAASASGLLLLLPDELFEVVVGMAAYPLSHWMLLPQQRSCCCRCGDAAAAAVASPSLLTCLPLALL